MNKKKLLIVALVTFCLVSALFIAMPALAGTAPPLDLYAAVKDIQNKSNWILGNLTTALPQLSTLQSQLTDLEAKLWSGTDSVKNSLTKLGWSVDSIVETLYPGGAFYNFVDTWFWNFDRKLDSIEQEASSGANALKVVYSASGYIDTTDNVEKILLRIRTNATCQITITMNVGFGADQDDYVSVKTETYPHLQNGETWMYGVIEVHGSWPEPTDEVHSVTYASNSTQIQFKCEDSAAAIVFQMIAIGPPNTVVTQFYTDYPQNVTATY